jgi:ABC-2 type transport system ATP-binding protein
VQYAIHATGLTKRFGTTLALDGLDLEVGEGDILGVLGPNGAGKTTAVSILTTLLEPDEGTAVVAGADVRTEPQLVRRRIGLSGQYAAVDEILTGYENLEMIGRLYRLGRRRARERARELLDRFDLQDAADRPVKGYSGGMRRRLDLAGALVAEPPVLFLDEPTTGLDPRSRIELWGVIRELVARGTTLLLTPHYLEEAEALCDRIAIVNQGTVVANDLTSVLLATAGEKKLTVTVDRDLTEAPPGLAARAELRGDRILALTYDKRTHNAGQVLAAVAAAGLSVVDVSTQEADLEDVFLELTRRNA